MQIHFPEQEPYLVGNPRKGNQKLIFRKLKLTFSLPLIFQCDEICFLCKALKVWDLHLRGHFHPISMYIGKPRPLSQMLQRMCTTCTIFDTIQRHFCNKLNVLKPLVWCHLNLGQWIYLFSILKVFVICQNKMNFSYSCVSLDVVLLAAIKGFSN